MYSASLCPPPLNSFIRVSPDRQQTDPIKHLPADFVR